jgi:hypothetical protein
MQSVALCRWDQGGGPDYYIISPGLHDCYHEPLAVEHHVLQLRKLAEHLKALKQKVIWVDMNPITSAVHDQPALKCTFSVNHHAQMLADEFGFSLFSRQSMIVTGYQLNDWSEFPMHQTDESVKVEVEYLLAWLSCVL